MLITFKSKAAADILMYEEHAKRMLDLLHKDARRGIITAAETGTAIATLEAEIAASSEQHEKKDGDDSGDGGHQPARAVNFATRVYPFLEMLRAAQKDGKDVVWGV